VPRTRSSLASTRARNTPASFGLPERNDGSWAFSGFGGRT
jgi:hypothetical protein